jgi:hypothetical protein
MKKIHVTMAGQNGLLCAVDGFVTKVYCDGFPPTAVVAFQEGEEQLEGDVVSVVS